MKFREIIPHKLYTRGRFDRHSKEAKLRSLREQRIDIGVNLIKNFDEDIAGPDGLEYYSLPIADGKDWDQAMVMALSYRLAERIRQGERILVHCNAGRNRSGLVCALIVRELWGISGSEALEYVRMKRPRAVDNPHFEEYLRSLSWP